MPKFWYRLVDRAIDMVWFILWFVTMAFLVWVALIGVPGITGLI